MLPAPSSFDPEFRRTFGELLRLRRDVRHFRTDPLPTGLAQHLVELASLAPSVGFSQPWRWIEVVTSDRRAAISDNFQHCNESALRGYSGEQAALYARLKLAGLLEAPVHLAVFVDASTPVGHGLGVQTMPEMLAYSAVCAVHTFWLAARAEGIGVGWISILDPVAVAHTLEAPADWKLIAYLCVGYPEEHRPLPELETEGWETRHSVTLLTR